MVNRTRHLFGALAGHSPAEAAVIAHQRLDHTVLRLVPVEAVASVWGLETFRTNLPATVDSTLVDDTILVRETLPETRIRRALAEELGGYLLGTEDRTARAAFADHLLLPDPLLDEFIASGSDWIDISSEAQVPANAAARRLREHSFEQHASEAVSVAMSYPVADVIPLRPRR